MSDSLRSKLCEDLFNAYREVVRIEYSAPFVSQSQSKEIRSHFENILKKCKAAEVSEKKLTILNAMHVLIT